MSETERRVYRACELRLNEAAGAPPVIEGYAAVFDAASEDLGGFVEFVRRGAFAKTLSEADVRATQNHDHNIVLGRTKSGTLTLSEDTHGLRVKIVPPDTQAARDLMTLMRRGDVSQMSFMFETIRDQWVIEGDQIQRSLLEVRLHDVSVVTYPAYPQTSAEVRSRAQQMKTTAAPGQAIHPAATPDGSQVQAHLSNLIRELDIAVEA